jgi:hypothetical protein
MHVTLLSIYIYIYIYIERERERERDDTWTTSAQLQGTLRCDPHVNPSQYTLKLCTCNIFVVILTFFIYIFKKIFKRY